MLYLKDTQYTFTGSFGRTRTGKTVTFTVLDNAGNLSANATIGSTVELGDGVYGNTITFTAEFNGYVRINNSTDALILYWPFTSKAST